MARRLDRDSLRARIEAEYAARGDRLGWRLLYSPEAVLDGAEVAFVGLNPGGDHAPPGHAEFAMPSGSAYLTESWSNDPAGKSPLQQQVSALFDALGVQPEHVLAGNLIPFRSPSWSALRDKSGATRFGVALWRDILDSARPRLVIVLGRTAGDTLAGELGLRLAREERVEWGDVTAGVWEGADLRLIRLPHLSRFAIVGRRKSEPALARLFGEDWRKTTDRLI
ncbi:MAG: uracil-DNA glycosylase family protein [Rhodosalinus sp.]|uniref:uracil-DNA glycosylase family protein n=1 Tax=Rhodosalinus sp. TaxID=2047741 RepID=UPI00397C95E9